MYKVKIVGATGYGGLGAIEILSAHPDFEISSICATQEIGRRIDEIYPHLRGVCSLPVLTHDDSMNSSCDAVLFATPDKVGMSMARDYVNSGVKVVDYSGDFRFNEASLYAEYASRIGKDEGHDCADLLDKSAYGLSELHREEIKSASLVGNPGCFAVSAILGAYPLVKSAKADLSTIIFDAKTGVSGAGKKTNAQYHYPHRYEEMNAYKIARHQHVMEVERELSDAAGSRLKVTFNTQVLPLVRGIMTSVYVKLGAGADYDELLSLYKSAYEGEFFIDVIDETGSAGNRAVRQTNKCALWVNLDRRTDTAIIVSHIDNLMKGQAGSAVQNLNIMFGLEESSGLTRMSCYP